MEITLKEFLQTHRQVEAAEVIGCTQGNVSQMLTSNRDIVFVMDDDGGVERVYERLHNIGRRGKAA